MTKRAQSYVKTRAEVIALLRHHGITPTQQRVEIGRILFEGPQHVSAEQVLNRINPHHRGVVSKATVYNTLGLFVSKGLIHEVVVDASKRFYDTNLTPHHHLYHVEHGMLEDIGADQVEINRLPTLPKGVNITGVDVIIRVCKTTP